MRELTAEERRVLDLIPQNVFTSYAAARIAEGRPAKRRACGHTADDPQPFCKTCIRQDRNLTSHGDKLAKEFHLSPEEMQLRLKQLHLEFERSGDDSIDYPAYVLLAFQINRRKAIELIRSFGMAK